MFADHPRISPVHPWVATTRRAAAIAPISRAPRRPRAPRVVGFDDVHLGLDHVRGFVTVVVTKPVSMLAQVRGEPVGPADGGHPARLHAVVRGALRGGEDGGSRGARADAAPEAGGAAPRTMAAAPPAAPARRRAEGRERRRFARPP